MNKPLIVIISLLALSVATPANAKSQYNFETGTPYIGFGGGNAKPTTATLFGEDNIRGGMAYLGVLVGNVFAVEVGSLSFSKKRDPDEDPTTANTPTGTAVYGDYTSLILRYPFSSFSAYTRLSNFNYTISVDGVSTEEGEAPGFGLGLDWFLTESWNIRYEVEKYFDIGVSETDIVHSRFAISYYF